jgi:hypothetical protein
LETISDSLYPLTHFFYFLVEIIGEGKGLSVYIIVDSESS